MNKMKQLSINLATMVVLCICLCVTSFALGYTVFRVEENTFKTGNIRIDLNGGQPIIQEDEYLFEPGMTVEKPFYIQNNSSWAVYYKLYFSGIKGQLGDILDISILNEEKEVLLSGKMTDLTKKNVPALQDELDVGECQNLFVRFHFPEGEGNNAQAQNLEFSLSAIAVQTKNNPNKEFE